MKIVMKLYTDIDFDIIKNILWSFYIQLLL